MKALRTAIALLLCAALCVCMFPAAFAEGEDDSLALLFPEPENIESSDSEEISFADLDKIASSEIAFPEPDAAAIMDEVSFGSEADMTLFEAETFDAPVDGAFYIPANATTIKKEAFANCINMLYVVIPATVTTIEEGAFSGCSNLIRVIFGGSEAQWRSIIATLGTHNEPLRDALVYFNQGGYWIPITPTYFPDDIFRSYVKSHFDQDNNGFLSDRESLPVETINCSGSADNPGHIRSLIGVKWFANLKALGCAYNELTELDVTGNRALKTLYCSNNPLTTGLDLRSNARLEQLYCSNNGLSSLNLTQNTALQIVYAHNNHLSTLNVTQNRELTGLYAAFNLFDTLDLSYNTKLQGLEFTGNKLGSLDLSHNNALKALYCGKNLLSSLIVTSTNLETLDCHVNLLTSLNLSGKTALKQLNCSGNRNLSFSITDCPLLLQVRRTVSPRTYDGVIYYYTDADSAYLIYDDPGGNASGGIPINAENFPDPIFRRGVSEFYDKRRDGILYPWEIEQVKLIDCNNLGIRNLKGIEYFTYLKTLRIYGNPLYSIDLSTLTDLQEFVCYNTYISTLNIRNNIYLLALANRVTPYIDYSINSYVYEYGTSYKLVVERGIRLYS
jgi:hypothetical protein